jgi:hypothetical protein
MGFARPCRQNETKSPGQIEVGGFLEAINKEFKKRKINMAIPKNCPSQSLGIDGSDSNWASPIPRGSAYRWDV